MTAPGNDLLYLALVLSIVVSSAYAAGRIHQWHRHGLERDEAYRMGYEKASHAIIVIMTDRTAAGSQPGRPARSSAPRGTGPTCSHRAPVNQRRPYPIHRRPGGRGRT
jgi:hypothetical protein